MPHSPLEIAALELWLASLPEDYKHYECLALNECRMETLPAGLYVGGWLDLENCTHLRKLPPRTYVCGWLRLSGCTALCELPSDLYVGSSLWLVDCASLCELPTSIRVRGNVYARGSGIKGFENETAEQSRCRYPSVNGMFVTW